VKVRTEAQKADNEPTYGMPFNWAEDIDAFVCPALIEPVLLTDIIPSRDPSRSPPTAPVGSVPIDENTISAHNRLVDADTAVPVNFPNQCEDKKRTCFVLECAPDALHETKREENRDAPNSKRYQGPPEMTLCSDGSRRTT
jgi:hypothetical protein